MTKHPLGSPYVRDQLSTRTIPLNEKRLQDLKINLIGDKLAEAARARKSP